MADQVVYATALAGFFVIILIYLWNLKSPKRDKKIDHPSKEKLLEKRIERFQQEPSYTSQEKHILVSYNNKKANKNSSGDENDAAAFADDNNTNDLSLTSQQIKLRQFKHQVNIPLTII